MIEIGKIYSHEDSDLAVEVLKITFESDVHYRVLAKVFIKENRQWVDGIKEYNIEKATIANNKWQEYQL